MGDGVGKEGMDGGGGEEGVDGGGGEEGVGDVVDVGGGASNTSND